LPDIQLDYHNDGDTKYAIIGVSALKDGSLGYFTKELYLTSRSLTHLMNHQFSAKRAIIPSLSAVIDTGASESGDHTGVKLIGNPDIAEFFVSKDKYSWKVSFGHEWSSTDNKRLKYEFLQLARRSHDFCPKVKSRL